MPLTKSGQQVLASMKKQYGQKKAKQVFYASINKGKAGSEGWHRMEAIKRRVGKNRRLGNPKTDEERKATHFKKYGTTKLPPRGSGLK